MTAEVKVALAPLRGGTNRTELEEKIETAVEQIEKDNQREDLATLSFREIQHAFGPKDKSKVNGKPHHMSVREAAVAVRGQPARRH